MAVMAGVDLLCLGRDTSEAVYLAVVAALSDAVRAGRLPGQRLEDVADRVAALRSWLASARASRWATGGGQTVTELNGTHIGLRAARRAVRLSGESPALTDPVIVEIEPQRNVAVGRAAWGLPPRASPGSIRRISSAPLAVVAVDTAPDGAVVAVDTAPDAREGEGTPAGGRLPAAIAADGAPAETGTAAEIHAAAAGRSLVLVVRDAHRSESTRTW